LEAEKKEQESRKAPKPKPKYDAKTGKWVVMNWDGSVAGVENGDQRSFENLAASEDSNNNHSSATTATTSTSSTPASIPFARIASVAHLSPASEAGLKEGDWIVQFGPLDYSNHESLQGLLPVVTAAADAQRAISIQLLRSQGEDKVSMTVHLVPKPWPGRGLIGCHIVPCSVLSS
jgi:hypothetical protein